MDEFTKRLRDDAECIDAQVSPELDRRIRASLEAARPASSPARARPRPTLFWWASSLTGIAAAVAVIAVVNRQPQVPQPRSAALLEPLPVMRNLHWKAEAAVLTEPLQQEINDLQTDLKKTEEAVRQDIDRLF